MFKATEVNVSSEERQELERRTRARSSEQRVVERAQIVLLAAEGKTNNAIAEQLGLHVDTVSKWRLRFCREGLEGLDERPRPGRPPVYDHDDRLKILKTVTETPPDPEAQWSGRLIAERLAKDVGISLSQVNRILQDLDLKPHKFSYWLTSHDPAFWDKAADVCGLYLDPPKNALVLSVDEKTGMQAKSRTNPTKPITPGTPERKEFEYQRNGTACLFAALNVHSGKVIHKTKKRNRSDEFVGFLKHLDRVTQKNLVLHLILDNGSSHISKDTKTFLEEHNVRFEVHHTPTHASWLNQVELFFSILARRLLRRGEFDSVPDLTKRITAFIKDYNRRAKPFKWTYEGKPLKAA